MKQINNEIELDEMLSKPLDSVIELMKRIDGDIILLGIGGKIGPSLGRMAKRAIDAAGVNKKVIGVSRFSNQESRKQLEEWGVETISCDLLDREAVATLPKTQNVIYLAGKKFGTDGAQEFTWAMNSVVPAYVAEHYSDSRIVAYSTGCVYPLEKVTGGGSVETDPPQPVGEYAQSCLGRERVFEYFSKCRGTKVLLYRLNYAIDLRYGVLHDIAANIRDGKPVDLGVAKFNVIWQGDNNNRTLLSLEHCASPAVPLNITGPESVSIKYAAERIAEFMEKPVEFRGEPGPAAYLSNAAKSFRLFGYPEVSLDQMLEWQAKWLMQGGSSLGKPTHFEVTDGKY